MPGLLALFAHPDDEFFCGGLLAALSARDVPIHLVYWTRGEGGGSPRARRFWGYFPQSWRPRTREAKQVARILHATSLTFLGAIDPVADPGLRAPSEAIQNVIKKISRLVTLHSPNLIVTHGSDGEYGHPAHQRLNAIAREFSSSMPALPVVSFASALPGDGNPGFCNVSDPADFILDARPYLEIKRNIVLAHRSQQGVLESLPGAGGTMETLLQAARYEGYHCWTARDLALKLLQGWTSAPKPV